MTNIEIRMTNEIRLPKSETGWVTCSHADRWVSMSSATSQHGDPANAVTPCHPRTFCCLLSIIGDSEAQVEDDADGFAGPDSRERALHQYDPVMFRGDVVWFSLFQVVDRAERFSFCNSIAQLLSRLEVPVDR